MSTPFRAQPSPPEQFSIGFLAAVPVGHRVMLDFHQHDGRLGPKGELARSYPVVTDLDTGIVWGNHVHFGASHFDVRPRPPTAERVLGVVRGTFVNDGTGNELAQTYTTLIVEVQSRGRP